MLDIYQSTVFTTPVIMVRNFDGFTVATGIVAADVAARYAKDGDTSLTTYTVSGTRWEELGRGLYDLTWTAGRSDTLGNFTFVVEVSGSVPFYGLREVVTAKTADVWSQVSGETTENIYGQVSGATTQSIFDQVDPRSTQDIYNAVTGLPVIVTNLPGVQVGASYDGTTLGLSLGLEREGEAVTSPISGSFLLFDVSGNQIASGSSVSSDAQGVFTFSTILTFADDTVPYLHGQVKDSAGPAIVTRQFLPVVG